MAAAPPPPVPPAAPAAPAVAGAIAPTRTFRAFFEQAPHNVEVIRRQMEPFDVMVGNVLPPTPPADVAASLYNLTAHARPCPLLVANTSATGAVEIKVVHSPIICPDLLDAPRHQWMGLPFASEGDVFHNETTIVQFPAQHYHLATNGSVRCLPANLIDDFYLANPNATVMGPFDANEPNVEELRVRNCCFLPPRIAARFIESSYTPREAWTQLSGAIVQEDNAIIQELQPLIRWLRVMVTVHIAGNNSPVVQPQLVTASSRVLREHRCSIIYRFLPDLDPDATARRDATIMASRIGDVANELQLQREAKRIAQDAKSAPKLPSSKWPELTPYLVNLCQVDNEQQLPSIWSRLANSNARDSRIVIQNCVEAACKTLPGVSSGLKIVIEPAVSNIIFSLQLRMVNDSSLDSGFQPFIMAQASSKATAKAAARNMLYDMGQAAGAKLDLDDVATLTTILAKDQITVDHLDALILVRRFYVVAAVLLGIDHLAVNRLARFMETYQSSLEDFLREREPTNAEYKGMMPTLIVRYLQVYWSHWLDSQWSSPGIVPCDDFSKVFMDIKLAKQWEIRLPTEYDTVLRQVLSPSVPPEIDATSQGTRSTITDVTGSQTGGSGTETGAGNRSQPIENTSYKEGLFGTFKSMRTSSGGVIPIKVVRNNARRAGGTVPKCPRNANLEMCISYHVLGRCQSNCNRNQDHYRHSDEEDSPLVQFCNDHWKESTSS